MAAHPFCAVLPGQAGQGFTGEKAGGKNAVLTGHIAAGTVLGDGDAARIQDQSLPFPLQVLDMHMAEGESAARRQRRQVVRVKVVAVGGK